MPPWMTIILVGHIVVPLMLHFVSGSTLSTPTLMGIWMAIILMLTITLLPRCKGIVLAILWITQARQGEIDPS